MANLSNVTYTANGATTIFVVPFSYIEEPDITVTVDGVTKTITTDYTFNGSGDVVFNIAPLNLEVVYISRDSDVTQRVTSFSDGSELTEADLNDNGDQSLYLHQETRDLINTLNVDNASVLGRVVQNEADIASNDADIAVLVGAVADNVNDIATNISNIDTNSSNIDTKVTGAASSTDNAIPKFDSTTGKIIQNTGVIISDTDEVSTTGDYVVFRGTSKEMELGEEVLESLSTGVTAPITLSINGGDTTKFDISIVDGHIVNRELDTYVTIAYAGSTGNSVSAVNGVTYIFIDKLGAVVKQTTAPTPSDLREMIYLGRAIAIAGIVVQVLAEPIPIENVASAVSDLAKSIRIFNASGNLVTSNGSNMNLDKSLGYLYSYGSNYATDRNNPSLVTVAASTISSFAYITQAAGSTEAATTAIDATYYDASGTKTLITGAGKQATVQRIFLFPSGAIRIAYGQTVYPTLAEAIQGTTSETFIDNPNIFGNGILIGMIALRKNTTDLSNSTQARFLVASRFGEGSVGAAGQSVSSLQDAYSNSSVGEVVLDSTLGAVKVRDNGTPIGANLFEVTDNSGSTKSLEVKIDSVDVSSTLNMKEISTPSTPASGYKSIYPKTDGKVYTLDDTGTEKEVGSGGGGGLDTVHTETFEDTINASSFTSGNNATYDNGGTLDGTLSDDTVTNISSNTSLKYLMGATSTNDFIKSPAIALDAKQQSQTLGMSFYYTYDGADDDIKVVVYDDTNSEVMTTSIDFLKASSTPQRFSVQFPTNSDTANLHYGIQVVTGNSGKILVIDDVEISSNPFVSKDLLDTQNFEEDSPTMTASTGDLRWGAISHTGSNILNYDDSNGRFTATRECQVYVSFSGFASTSISFNIKKNTVTVMVGAAAANTQDTPSATLKLNEGDYVVLNTTTTIISPKLTITATAETNHIVAYNSRNAENSMVRLHTGNGHGSTNTAIRRFSTAVDNIGNAITYADSSTDGASFTINEDGLYYISYSDGRNASGQDNIGISLNSTQLTSNIATINAADRLIEEVNTPSNPSALSWAGQLSKDDVIRAHTGSTANLTTATSFTISKIGVGDLLGVPTPRTAYIKDVKSSGTNGGTFTSGAWQTRDLNTLEGDTEFVSLSSNQFTLQSGKYNIEAYAPAMQVNGHVIKIRDITSSVDIIIGTSGYAATSGASNLSKAISDLEVISNTTFEVQHRCNTTKATNGLGNPLNFGVDEVYTTIKITKLPLGGNK